MGPHPANFFLMFAQDEVQLNWPTWGSFRIPKLVYLCSQIENHGSKIKQTELYAYFNWYREVSKHIQDSKLMENK